MPDWQVALAQHPMYLIIKEDSECAERTPPWGEPTIERYIARVRDGLSTLRRYPQLKIGFEWSALELEMLAEDGPDVLAEMLALAREGRVAFYNGTYAQPHLQTLSSEANFRQLEQGLAVYHRLCGDCVRVYQHQESSVHDQVPQLLRSFGIELATIPHFLTTLAWLDEGEMLVRHDKELAFVHGHEFAAWQGLDGSTISLYLNQPSNWWRMQDWLAQQRILGLLHAPPLVVHTPDLVALNDEWLAGYDGAEIVLLNQALPDRLSRYPARARARLFSQWSYIEGIRAEELSGSNHQAEAAVLRADALQALAYALLGPPAPSTTAIWKTILGAQHHDAYCFSAPELRAKAIARLNEAEADAARMADQAASAVAGSVDTGVAGEQALVVFNIFPYPVRDVVTVDVPGATPEVRRPHRAPLPVEAIAGEKGSTRLRFVADLPGFGYATYRLPKSDVAAKPAAQEEEASEPVTFENAFYQATIQPDATFSLLILTQTGLQQTGEALVDSSTGSGNVLRGSDSRGIAPQAADLHEMHEPRRWPAATPLPELAWESAAPARVRRSPLGLTLLAQGRLGDQVSVAASVTLYHALPRIDLEFVFSFDNASIGAFYDDETKLRLEWPLAFSGDMHHDIPFGVVKAWPERPLLPTSWIDICDGRKGLAYFHQGTQKHWVKGATEGAPTGVTLTGLTLSNLFAWGEDTDAIGSRIGLRTWPKGFDQRLRGEHHIRCAVYPHAGDWRQAGLVRAAQSYGQPLVALHTAGHGGRLASEQNLLTLADPDLAATCVMSEGSDLLCRVYAFGESPSSLAVKSPDLAVHSARSITEGEKSSLNPFQIGELRLRAGR